MPQKWKMAAASVNSFKILFACNYYAYTREHDACREMLRLASRRLHAYILVPVAGFFI